MRKSSGNKPGYSSLHTSNKTRIETTITDFATITGKSSLHTSNKTRIETENTNQVYNFLLQFFTYIQ